MRYTKQLKEQPVLEVKKEENLQELEAKRLAALKNYIMKEIRMSDVVKKHIGLVYC